MRRDLDLMRDLLLQAEGLEPGPIERSPWFILHGAERDSDEVRYHVRMLIEQGFLYEEACNLFAGDQSGASVVKCRPDAVTNAGHDFIADMRDPKTWSRTKEVAQKVGAGSIGLIVEIGTAIIKQEIAKWSAMLPIP